MQPVPDAAAAIAVTGLGSVTALGWSCASLEEGIFEPRSGIRPITRFDAGAHRTHLAAQVPREQPETQRTKGARRLSLTDRFALAAAHEAVGMARLPREALAAAGVFVGTSSGGLFEAEGLYRSLGDAAMRPRLGVLASHPLSSPANAIARRLSVTGPVETWSSACASGALAIEAAAIAIREGTVDIALAGGSDSITEIIHAGFNALRAVDARECRPFMSDRAGLTLGEGAGFLILEGLEHARARGARVLALLTGCASSCDAGHMTAPHPEGAGAAAAMAGALANAGLGADDTCFVNAHGTGTTLNDPAEWAALSSVLGARAREVPVSATKALIGHLLGAAGAVEAVATILCLRRGLAHPVPRRGSTDETMPLRLVVESAEPLAATGAAISLSLGFGGANAALVFERERSQ